MKANEMLNEIKSVLGIELTEEKTEIQLAQMKLENGTVLESEAFEAGNEVFILTDDEKVALPVGEYLLEDGKILVVVDEGIISEIRDAEEDAEEDQAEEETPAEEEAPAEEVEEELAAEDYATKAELEEIKMMIDEVKAMIEKKDEKLSDDVVENDVELSSVEPAAKPIKHNPEANQDQRKINLYGQSRTMTTVDRIMQKFANK
jgi:hypothetical protein